MSEQRVGAIGVTVAAAFAATEAQAEDDLVAAGNGGAAEAAANGGAINLGDLNSGGNVGNPIGVGDSWESVAIDGGTVATSTMVTGTVGGGISLVDASGGDYGIALIEHLTGPDSAGHGGDNHGGGGGFVS